MSIPVFFVFPIAFMLNRLGQHYDIDPADPAKWSTLVRGHWFWDFAFLNSNYHLEHHYFAGVPFYRLPALQRALVPFYERHGMRWQTYSGLLHGWLIENRAPHTDWTAAPATVAVAQACERLAAMDFRLTEEQTLLRRSVREFAETEIRPHVMEWDQTQHFPDRARCRSSARSACSASSFPKRTAAPAMSAVDYCICIEELARVDPGVALSVAAHNGLCTGAHLSVRHRGAEAALRRRRSRAARRSARGG